MSVPVRTLRSPLPQDGEGPATAVRAVRIGALARLALERCGGHARPIEAFPDAPYRYAGDAIIWIGARARSMHPRMVQLAMPVPQGSALRIDASTSELWHAQQPALDDEGRVRFVERARALRDRIGALGETRGFGTLLVSGQPPFPLDLAVVRVRRLEAAVAANDLAAIEEAARSLLGVGTGLTPSGDDLVGGLLFGRRLIDLAAGAAWHALASRLADAAQARTHVISAALFADLARGESYGLLHDLVDALAGPEPIEAALARAHALVAIGHSSGWDMLTGFFIGVGDGR